MPSLQATKIVGYFVNVYPAPSHSFIRREILALEKLGWNIERFSIRKDSSLLKDPADQKESQITHVLLNEGDLRYFFRSFAVSSAVQACSFRHFEWPAHGRKSERGMLYHLIYLVEACRLRELCSERNVPHLHAHFGTNSTAIAALCRILGGPSYSFTIHGPEEFDKALLLSLPSRYS